MSAIHNSDVIRVSWYNDDHTVVLWETIGHVKWQEAYEARMKLYNLLETVEHKVVLMVNVVNPYIPPGAITNIKRLLDAEHPNEGTKVVIGAPPFAVAMFKLVCKFSHQLANNWHFVDTLDEANVFVTGKYQSV